MDNFKPISLEKAHELIETARVTLVDIRDQVSFETAHIKGAIQVNDHSIARFLEEALKDQPLICYCYHGISSQNAAQFFVSKGFQQVYSLEGGFEAWKSKYV